jgi:RNA polymerase sigma-70 factor (ECF subfamily)
MSYPAKRMVGSGRWRDAWREPQSTAGNDALAVPPVARDADEDVIDQVDRGELKGAIDRLMRRYGASVYRYCREALRDATLADDVLQQVFMEAYRDLPRFGRRSTVRVWLFAIARHRALDAAKRRRRRRDSVEDTQAPALADLRPSPLELIDDKRLREALVASVGELDERIRTPLLLRYQQGFTFDEIAEICREKAGTLRARVVRALPLLRVRIEARLRAGHRRRAAEPHERSPAGFRPGDLDPALDAQ